MIKKQWTRNRPKQAYKLALLGATDDEIAEFMEVSVHTLQYWKRTKPGFLKMLNKGKKIADAKVAHSLYRRALGYSHPEDHISVYKGKVIVVPTIKHYPPDTMAAKAWLGVRQRELWTETTRVESSHTNVNITKFDFSDLSTEELMVLKKVGLKQAVLNAQN